MESRRFVETQEVPGGPCGACRGSGLQGRGQRHRGARPFKCLSCHGHGVVGAHCELRHRPPPRIRPEDCAHPGISMHEYFRGNGRAVKFVCNDCDAELKPVWRTLTPGAITPSE